MSQWFFLMESLSELDGGLTGRLGATLHTTGPCVFGKETPLPEGPVTLPGRRDLKGVLSRSLMGPTSDLISIRLTSWLSALGFFARPVWKYLCGEQNSGFSWTGVDCQTGISDIRGCNKDISDINRSRVWRNTSAPPVARQVSGQVRCGRYETRSVSSFFCSCSSYFSEWLVTHAQFNETASVLGRCLISTVRKESLTGFP